ncbi:hypothetical protein X943_003441 [Babesia divergens]|uniref:RanBP2-type domain-containing protein n=1 Tax=Babesia divergens TaxID=32595 RepID=A0AAD9GIA0_BABDI|nr:hypothetical protein X943_003441 [Babesia divergens]
MELRTGDWICPVNSCSNINFAKRDFCNRCKTARPKDKAVDNIDIRQLQFNDWICEHCGNANWSRRTHCNICKHSKVVS